MEHFLEIIRGWQLGTNCHRGKHPVLGTLLLLLIGAVIGFAVMAIAAGIALEIALLLYISPALALTGIIAGAVFAVRKDIRRFYEQHLERLCKPHQPRVVQVS